tara:strand:- start:94 stop:285 length:192 start_codon:yes stop_codon:yes gene_type:complete
MTSCEDIVKTEEEKIKFQVSHSKVLLELNEDKIQPGQVHENNQTVIDWLNHHRKIIKDNDDKI